MFTSFRKSFIAVSVGLVIATSIMPSRVCSISMFCPVREARAEGGIMDNPMMLMMLIMLLSQMMAKGKQGERTQQGASNLYQAGQGGGGVPTNPLNPNYPAYPNYPGYPNNGGTFPVNSGFPNTGPIGGNPNPLDPTTPLNIIPLLR